MILGESPRAATCFHLERYQFLRRHEILRRLEDFSMAIRKIFGLNGPVMEELILRRLCERLDVDYENVKDNQFEVAVEKLRKRSAGLM